MEGHLCDVNLPLGGLTVNTRVTSWLSAFKETSTTLADTVMDEIDPTREELASLAFPQ